MNPQARADTAAGPSSLPTPTPASAPARPAAGEQSDPEEPGPSGRPSERPTDLVTWAQFAEETARTPHPMDRRELQRFHRRIGGRVWTVPGLRGERVSRSDALELHRDMVRARQQAVVA